MSAWRRRSKALSTRRLSRPESVFQRTIWALGSLHWPALTGAWRPVQHTSARAVRSKRPLRQLFDGLSKAGRVSLPAQPPPSMPTLLLETVSAQDLPVVGDSRGKGIQDVPVVPSALPATNAPSPESELEPGLLGVGDVATPRVGVLENGFCTHRLQLTSSRWFTPNPGHFSVLAPRPSVRVEARYRRVQPSAMRPQLQTRGT